MSEQADHQAFLDAIAADPYDVTTRRVFADYLDEHDEPELADHHRRWTREAYDAAKAWLTEFADRCGEASWDGPLFTYEDMVQIGKDRFERGDYFTQQGSQDAQDAFYDDGVRETFWRCWGLVTDTIVPEDRMQDGAFSCSC